MRDAKSHAAVLTKTRLPVVRVKNAANALVNSYIY